MMSIERISSFDFDCLDDLLSEVGNSDSEDEPTAADERDSIDMLLDEITGAETRDSIDLLLDEIWSTPASPFVVPVHQQSEKWFTPAEDALLCEAVATQNAHKHQRLQWDIIAALIPGRDRVQCRQRWEKVRPGVHKGKWTTEEDRALTANVEQCGTLCWSTIAASWSLWSQSTAVQVSLDHAPCARLEQRAADEGRGRAIVGIL
jgi:hypothetical protein